MYVFCFKSNFPFICATGKLEGENKRSEENSRGCNVPINYSEMKFVVRIRKFGETNRHRNHRNERTNEASSPHPHPGL